MADRILVADDESDVLLILKSGLEMEGYEVVTAVNGEEAVEKAKAEKPDLILLDVMMPKLDGFGALEKLKEEETTCTIPVIMLTGLSDRARIQQALSSGSNFYIVKPFDFDDVVNKVRTALRSGGDDGPSIEIV